MAHGQVRRQKAKVSIGLTEKLGDGARATVSDKKEAEQRTASQAKWFYADQNRQQQEQQRAFEQGFIQLARVPRVWAAAGKHHRPGNIAWAAKQFRIDEIGDTPKKQADRCRAGDVVADGQCVKPAASGKPPYRRHNPEQAAMERHSALPNEQDVDGMRQIIVGPVEQRVAEPASQDHAKSRPDDEIIDVLFIEGGIRQARQGDDVAPAEQQSGDIGQCVPANRKRSELDQNRIDCGI